MVFANRLGSVLVLSISHNAHDSILEWLYWDPSPHVWKIRMWSLKFDTSILRFSETPMQGLVGL